MKSTLKRLRIGKNNAGDTLVEVLLAAVILSITLAGAYALSTRATRLNQSAYERTRASNLVQEQAELITAAADEDGDAWLLMLDMPVEPYYDCRSDAAVLPPDISGLDNQGTFYLDGDGEEVRVNGLAAKSTDDIYYTWVARKQSAVAGFHDFYVYTCWEGIGTIGNQVSGTVVRVEEP